MKYALLAIALAASTSAFATDVYHEEGGNAISLCTPARPVYDAGIRRRPLAIVNETNAAGAFINCGFRAPTNSDGQEFFSVVLFNTRTTSVSVNCTGVTGQERGTGVHMPRYISRTVTIPANGMSPVTFAYQVNNSGVRWKTNTAIQCNLPTGVGISELNQGYRQQ